VVATPSDPSGKGRLAANVFFPEVTAVCAFQSLPSQDIGVNFLLNPSLFRGYQHGGTFVYSLALSGEGILATHNWDQRRGTFLR
jgi:hypothetical protein